MMRTRHNRAKHFGASTSLLLQFLLAVTFVSPAVSQPSDEKVIFPEQAAVLTPREILQCEKDAMAGNADSAHKLATYFAMIKLDNKMAIYWQEIRLEDGDRDARYDLGAALSVDSDPLNRLRARYWLEQTVRDGPPKLADLAKFALESLDDREELER